MKKIIQKFEELKTKYLSRRESFKDRIENYTSRSSRKARVRGLELIDVADTLVRELTHDLVAPAHEHIQLSIIKKKLRTFKKTYKELHELAKPGWRQWVEAIGIALLLALLLRNFIFGLYHVPTGSAERNILVGDRIWGNKMIYFFKPVKRGDLVIFDNPVFDYDRSSSLNYYWQRYIGLPIPLLGLSSGPDNWVKRVIAVPGDVIEGKVEEGKTVIYRNGKKLDEPYVNPYPLIALNKTKGFIPWSHVGPIPIPSFLYYETKLVHYTYDPSKPYDQQPYYYIENEEVVKKPGTDEPVLDYAFTPYYDRRLHLNVDVFGPYKIPEKKYWVMGDSRKNSQDSRWWLFLDEELIHGRASFVIYSIDSEEAFWIFDLIKNPLDFWRKHVRWNRFLKSLNGYNHE